MSKQSLGDKVTGKRGPKSTEKQKEAVESEVGQILEHLEMGKSRRDIEALGFSQREIRMVQKLYLADENTIKSQNAKLCLMGQNILLNRIVAESKKIPLQSCAYTLKVITDVGTTLPMASGQLNEKSKKLKDMSRPELVGVLAKHVSNAVVEVISKEEIKEAEVVD